LSQLHLLVTNGDAIETLSKATLAMFDKTGTLTLGEPRIAAVMVTDNDWSEHDCRRIAAALEHPSTHPLARAFAIEETLPAVTDHEIVIGRGVSGVVGGRSWRLGNAGFVGGGAATEDSGATHVFLGTDDHVVAWFELEDTVRPDAKETLSALRALGLNSALVSGDNRLAVDAAASHLGIENTHAACTPDDKLRIIKSAQETGERVVMVGDGINDAPVLAGADTSIALAQGALLAQTSADVIMLGDSLKPLTTAVEMARKTMRIVRQNLAWAIVYNALALPLAAAGYVPPWAAAIGMSASSLVVVLNALRLNRFE
jgi:Cu2+-exporting ATPase